MGIVFPPPNTTRILVRAMRKIRRVGIQAVNVSLRITAKAFGKLKSPAMRLVGALKAAVFRTPSAEETIFHGIFLQNAWGSEESHSGAGSTLVETDVIREALPRLVERYGIKTFLDLPCGDFNWMRHVRLGVDRYIGGDIVDDLVEANESKYGGAGCNFQKLNLLASRLPKADLVFCRDCLVHLSYADVQRAIANLRRSGIKYLLATTFTNRNANDEIQTGLWTPYNLQIEPFNFPEPIELINENCMAFYPDFNDKCLGLWMIEDLPRKLSFKSGCKAA